MAFEGRKSRVLKDDTIEKELEELVPPSTFRIWRKSEIPAFLKQRPRESDGKRASYENQAVLVVATAWSGGKPLGDQIPSGIAYNICYYRDDLDQNQEQEFNKDPRWVYRATDNKLYNYPYYDEEHSVAAECTGTSMAWLDRSFRLPGEDTGSITLLDKCGTRHGDHE